MRKLLVDLDCLLDTRLAVLANLDQEAASYVARHTAYWDRDHTDWDLLTNGRVTQAQFDEAWNARTGDILPLSTMTGIFLPIIQLLTDYQTNVADGMVEDDILLEINVHPYELNDDERDALTLALRSMFYKELVITFCSRPLETLTPQILVDKYDSAFMYDFIPWMKRHAFGVSKCRNTDFSLLVPRLFEKDVSHLTMDEKKKEILSFRLWLHAYLDLEFLEPRWFSMFRPKIDKTAQATSP